MQGASASDPKPTDNPPTSAPMSTPEAAQGDELQAKVNLRIALDLLQQTAAKISDKSPLGLKLKAINTSLASAIGLSDMSKTEELVPAQLQMMMAQLPQTGNATPAQKAAQATPMSPQAAMPQGQPQQPPGV